MSTRLGGSWPLAWQLAKRVGEECNTLVPPIERVSLDGEVSGFYPYGSDPLSLRASRPSPITASMPCGNGWLPRVILAAASRGDMAQRDSAVPMEVLVRRCCEPLSQLTY